MSVGACPIAKLESAFNSDSNLSAERRGMIATQAIQEIKERGIQIPQKTYIKANQYKSLGKEEPIAFMAMVQIASLVVGASFFTLFALIPNIFTTLVMLPVAYLSYEAFTIAENATEICTDTLTNTIAGISHQNLCNQLTKQAPLAKAVIDWLDLDFRMNPISIESTRGYHGN